MQYQSRCLKSFIALRRVKTLAVALLVPVITIGVLGAAVPAMQAQQAVLAAPAGFQNAAPSPKAETPPPAESSADSPAVILARIANSGLPERGAHNAKVTIVFFDDFQCPYSGFMYSTLFDEVMRDYSDRVKVLPKSFPLSKIHPWARRAAIDSYCLAARSDDAFWEFADAVHSNDAQISKSPSPFLDALALEKALKYRLDINSVKQCLAAQPDPPVENDIAEAKALGVKGTPTLFVNGERVYGSVSARTLRATIDRALDTTVPVVPVLEAPITQNNIERNNEIFPIDVSSIETGLFRFAQLNIRAPTLRVPDQNNSARKAPDPGAWAPQPVQMMLYEEKKP